MNIFKKNLSILFVFLITVSALTGCQSQKDNEKDMIDNAPLARRIGVIKSLGGVATPNNATHLLQLDNGDNIFLKSVAIDLSNKKYLDNKVEVRGSIIYNKGEKPLMEVENIDVINDSFNTAVAEKVLEWKIFDNANAGYSIKYRNDFIMKKGEDVVEFFKDDESDSKDISDDIKSGDVSVGTASLTDSTIDSDGHNYLIDIRYDVKKEGDTLNSFLKLSDKEDSASLLAKNLKGSKIGTQSLTAYKKQVNDNVFFYTEGKDNFYTISFKVNGGEDVLKYQNLFYEMIASFDLANPIIGDEDVEFDDTLVVEDDGSVSVEDLEKGAAGAGVLDEGQDEGDMNDSGDVELDNEGAANNEDVNKNSDDDSTLNKDDSVVDDNESNVEESEGSDETDSIAELPKNFAEYKSDTFNFSIGYPANWYFEGATPTETGSIRHYDFSSKPLDKSNPLIGIDIIRGDAKKGSVVNINGVSVYKSVDGGNIIYYRVVDGKTYKIEGSNSNDSVMKNMISTIK